ncbi:RloB family protein [Herbiconiux sp. CPCC 205763]|uniref:RloB family protein n=1 Tax=Herbiconiux aconitum TaxID=2970913 RepID=A0ABT2GV65_9MICO|nr:RloB family protein [Herbiconiux aconitum]MCS5718834.1 RloB family protein [Herbiconiux aconitum]
MGRRAPANLKRRGPSRRERYVIAVFSEGEATEPEYFRALVNLPEIRQRAKLELRISLTGAVPLTLVQDAVASKKSQEADEYWCVFDVEWPRQHPNLREASDLATRSGVHLAISNPCFEAWLILHFVDHNAHLDNDGARRRRRDLDYQGDKHLDPDLYLPHRATAAARAKRLEERHASDGNQVPHNNPSSSAYLLVAAIERAGSR